MRFQTDVQHALCTCTESKGTWPLNTKFDRSISPHPGDITCAYPKTASLIFRIRSCVRSFVLPLLVMPNPPVCMYVCMYAYQNHSLHRQSVSHPPPDLLLLLTPLSSRTLYRPASGSCPRPSEPENPSRRICGMIEPPLHSLRLSWRHCRCSAY